MTTAQLKLFQGSVAPDHQVMFCFCVNLSATTCVESCCFPLRKNSPMSFCRRTGRTLWLQKFHAIWPPRWGNRQPSAIAGLQSWLREKSTNFFFFGPKWPVGIYDWEPLFYPKIPPKSLCGSLSCSLYPGNEAHIFLWGHPKLGCGVGAKSVC